MKKNRVCIIRHYYYPEDTHIRRDAERLLEAGFDVDIIALRNKGEKLYEMVDGVKVYRVPIPHKRNIIVLYLLEYLIFFTLSSTLLSVLYIIKHYRIIEVDTLPDWLVFSALLPKILGAKIILYMFELTPELIYSSYPIKILKKIFIWIEQISISFADRVITVNQILKESFIKRGVLGNKIDVVLNVPDDGRFNTSKKVSIKGKNKFVLVTHGSILKRYGYQTVIEAINTIPDLNIEYWIIGEGEYLAKLKKMVSCYRLEEKIKFRGYIKIENIPFIISQADVGVVPLIDDGYTLYMLPMKLFEYVELEVPVIASGLPIMQYYFPESSIMYFEPSNYQDLAEKILYLYNHPEKRKELVKNGSEIYEKYKWSKMKKEYLKVYEHLLRER